jgi:hypothetical protein
VQRYQAVSAQAAAFLRDVVTTLGTSAWSHAAPDRQGNRGQLISTIEHTMRCALTRKNEIIDLHSGMKYLELSELSMSRKELPFGLGLPQSSTNGAPHSSRVRVAIAVGCVLVSAAAGCSSRSPFWSTPSAPASTSAVAPLPATSAVQPESIPGIGATRAIWDAWHTRNAANNDGSAYGDDPSLPSYLTDNGAVYSDVDQALDTGRIQFYNLNMHTVEPNEVLLRVRQELPSDATVAWDLTLDQCYRVAFNSPTLQAAGDYMAGVQLQYIQEDGTRAPSTDRFNLASFWLDRAGSPPNPEIGCDKR